MLILVGSFLLLLIIGVPVALSMAVSSLLYIMMASIPSRCSPCRFSFWPAI